MVQGQFCIDYGVLCICLHRNSEGASYLGDCAPSPASHPYPPYLHTLLILDTPIIALCTFYLRISFYSY